MRVTILPPAKPNVVLDLTDDEAQMLRAVLARQLRDGPIWLDSFTQPLDNALHIAGITVAESAL